jgi:Multiubiquitin
MNPNEEFKQGEHGHEGEHEHRPEHGHAEHHDKHDHEHHEEHRHPVKFDIFVNTREKIVHEKEISYVQVVELAYPNVPEDPKLLYTITYSKGPAENPSGTLVKGKKVKVKNEMEFNVTPTVNS